MALIKSVRGFTPKIGKDCFLADNATIVGDVTMGDECSVWFNAVLRGDVNTITIGDRVNIQDGTVLHSGALAESMNITLSQYGVWRIVYTAEDALGNTASRSFNITVADREPPDITVNGVAYTVADDVKLAASAENSNSTVLYGNFEDVVLKGVSLKEGTNTIRVALKLSTVDQTTCWSNSGPYGLDFESPVVNIDKITIVEDESNEG